ncbi:16S rRNA (guanine(527)-N(7))-methyltransferase RsmG [Gammaproteobacteria bacterium]|nr:16S rRNA (guanine(527)-N(7))-methyltransferase RsmG [Gammaproteobacteria bacterium]
MSESLRQTITAGLFNLDLDSDSHQIDQAIKYLNLLEKWNRTYNLVAKTSTNELATRHLLDSLSINKHLEGHHILDLGSGAGLPGVPLAIFSPSKKFTLLDSNGKKTRFLSHVKTDLNLKKVTVENSRVENYQCKDQIDMVVCRAFASLAEIVEKAKHLFLHKCKILAMKGRFPSDEISQLPRGYRVVNSFKLDVSSTYSQRHLIVIGKEE